MKITKVLLITLLLGILIYFLDSCCNTETPPIIEEKKGKIAFYTNVHDLLSIDTVKVSLYLDSVLVGHLVKSGIGDSMDFNINTDSLFLIEKPVGSYNYVAKTNSDNPLVWKGTVNVFKDSLVKIPLNAMDVVDKLTRVRFMLIGAWKDYSIEALQRVIFTRKDTVLEMIYERIFLSGSYKIISKDSIEVERPTLDPKRHPRITRHKMIFSGNDTLYLKDFTRTTTSTFGYSSRYLVRIKK